MYSPDRRKAFEVMLAFLSKMSLYNRCQRTLVVDGASDTIYEGWKNVEVPRIDGEFCWANMWDAGVATAKHDKIIYLDSDRLLPAGFLQQMNQSIEDDVFVFTSNHFQLLQDMLVEECVELIEHIEQRNTVKMMGKVRFEPKFSNPVHGSGKNVMSGCTGFTKKTYYRLNGVDPWYRGHGAFADTDLHFSAKLHKCKFIDLGVLEMHYHHSKLGNDGKAFDAVTLRQLSLDNFIYYCIKWKLSNGLAEGMAADAGIRHPAKFVQRRKKEILREIKEFSRVF